MYIYIYIHTHTYVCNHMYTSMETPEAARFGGNRIQVCSEAQTQTIIFKSNRGTQRAVEDRLTSGRGNQFISGTTAPLCSRLLTSMVEPLWYCLTHPSYRWMCTCIHIYIYIYNVLTSDKSFLQHMRITQRMPVILEIVIDAQNTSGRLRPVAL